MCEWCDRLEEAKESGDDKAYDRAKIGWIREHAGEEAAMVYTVATASIIGTQMEEHGEEMGNAMHLAGWASAEVVRMLIDSPLDILLKPEVMGGGNLLMEVFSTVFWYGLLVGKRDNFAKKILMGQVADVP